MSEAPGDGLKDPYLVPIYLTTSEHLNLYNKAILGLPGKQVLSNQILLD